MKRYFITLMAVLFLCLGFSSVQTEAKTNVIKLTDVGNKHHKPQKLKLGDNKVICNEDLDVDFENYYIYFDVTKKGYYTFTLSNFVANKNANNIGVGCNIMYNTPMNGGEYYYYLLGKKMYLGECASETVTLYFTRATTVQINDGTQEGSVHYNIKYSTIKPAGKVIKPASKYLKYNVVSGGFDSGITYGNPYLVLGRNYFYNFHDSRFTVPYTGKYKVTQVTKENKYDSNLINVDVISPKYRDNIIDKSGYVELNKGEVLDMCPVSGFVDITLISADMGTKTLKYNDNLSLKTGVKGKATWKVSNSRAKIVKTSSKYVQIKGVKEGKVKVTAKVGKTSYIWTINVKKTAAQKKQEEADKYANSTLEVRYDLLYNDKSKGLAFISSKEYRSTDLNISTVIDIYSGDSVVNSIPYSCACLDSESTVEISSSEGLPITDVKLRDSKISKSTEESMYNNKIFVESKLVRVQENGESVIGLIHYNNVSDIKHCLFYVTWYNDDTGELICYTRMGTENIEVELPEGFDDTNTSEDPTFHNGYCY